MGDLVGQNLGPYRILDQIGLGGMATVYKAYHAAMDRYVAIKVLPQHLARDPEFRLRFQREARTIARLEHRYILPVHDFGEDEGIPYLVMRYTDSGDLSDLIATRSLTIARSAWLISHVAEALAYAHRLGVIHRDVKPANVLLGRDGDVLLTDFGIAKIYEETLQLTGEGMMIGTPAYMAPEQLQGKTVDARSDIYALGVMLYQALTGECPFVAETPLAVALMHMHNPLRPPRQLNPNIPEALERIVLRALAKNPDDRFQTADALAEALRDALADLSRSTAVVAGPAAEPDAGALAPPAAPTPPIPTAPTPAPAAEPVTRQPRGAPHLHLWLAGAAVVALTIVLGVFLLKVITPDLSKQATEVPARLVETQVVATVPAGQSSTAMVEQAVAVTLTAEPTTVVPPTDTPVPTATKTPAVQATAVPPTPTAVLPTAVLPTAAPPTAIPPLPTAAVIPQTQSDKPNWIVTWQYRFAPGFWSIGTHEYTIEADCPNIKDASGSWTNTFQVSEDASLLPGKLYLRFAGVKKEPIGAAPSIEKIHPAQSTIALFGNIGITRTEAEQMSRDCKVTVSWDGGTKQLMGAQTPYYEEP